MRPVHELILGGARSGKSKMAEERALDSGLDLVYVATATAGDSEMAERIRHHRQRRGSQWSVVEEPVSLADVLRRHQDKTRCILVDCLTLWLNNCLQKNCWERQKASLLDILPKLEGHIIMVSNETGLGVVPMGELSRDFVDEAGFLHQQLAAQCHQVSLMVAGLPLVLKPMGKV